MSERDLVQMLATPKSRLDAMCALAGGITATELRAARVSDASAQALARIAADDPNAKVRAEAALALHCRTS